MNVSFGGKVMRPPTYSFKYYPKAPVDIDGRATGKKKTALLALTESGALDTAQKLRTQGVEALVFEVTLSDPPRIGMYFRAEGVEDVYYAKLSADQPADVAL